MPPAQCCPRVPRTCSGASCSAPSVSQSVPKDDVTSARLMDAAGGAQGLRGGDRAGNLLGGVSESLPGSSPAPGRDRVPWGGIAGRGSSHPPGTGPRCPHPRQPPVPGSRRRRGSDFSFQIQFLSNTSRFFSPSFNSVTQADSYTVYRSPATGLRCHISPVNLPVCQLSLSLSSRPDKYSFYWGIFHFSSLSPSLSLSPQLVPLIGFISVGLGSAVLYLLRLALYSPDVRYGSGRPRAPPGHSASAPGAEEPVPSGGRHWGAQGVQPGTRQHLHGEPGWGRTWLRVPGVCGGVRGAPSPRLGERGTQKPLHPLLRALLRGGQRGAGGQQERDELREEAAKGSGEGWSEEELGGAGARGPGKQRGGAGVGRAWGGEGAVGRRKAAREGGGRGGRARAGWGRGRGAGGGDGWAGTG